MEDRAAGAFLGPGARLLDRTRLPTGEPGKPAGVGDRTRIGGTVVCGGNTVGRNAVVAAVEDDVPDDAVWMGGRVTGQF